MQVTGSPHIQIFHPTSDYSLTSAVAPENELGLELMLQVGVVRRVQLSNVPTAEVLECRFKYSS